MNEIASQEILLALLRTETVAVTTEGWQAIAPLANRHSVAPLLYQRLKTMSVEVPEDIRSHLRNQYRRTALRNRRLYSELASVLNLFDRENVPAIILKGGYLAEHIYGNIAVRPMRDLDLLIGKKDLKRVEKLMIDMDFARTDQSTEILPTHRHFRYLHNSSESLVEIHWDLIEATFGVRVDLDALWERSRPAVVAGAPVRAMTPEDQLLHLCIHTSNHVFEHGLRALYDLTVTLRYYESVLDWRVLVQRAHTWNAGRCLYVNLWLARELLHAPVPDDQFNAIKPKDLDQRYVQLAQERLFGHALDTSGEFKPDLNVIRFWAEKGWRRRLKLWWQAVFPERQMMAVMYDTPPNSWLIFWYYTVRPIDLLQRHGRLLWGLFRGDEKSRSYAGRQEQADALRNWLLAK